MSILHFLGKTDIILPLLFGILLLRVLPHTIADQTGICIYVNYMYTY